VVQIRVKYLPFCIIRSLWSGFKMQTQGNRHIFDSLHMAKNQTYIDHRERLISGLMIILFSDRKLTVLVAVKSEMLIKCY